MNSSLGGEKEEGGGVEEEGVEGGIPKGRGSEGKDEGEGKEKRSYWMARLEEVRRRREDEEIK